MAYTKQTWATGDTITAAKLNHMEDGIAAAGRIMFINSTSGKLDKTVREIYDAMTQGIRCVIVIDDGPLEDDGGIGHWAIKWVFKEPTNKKYKVQSDWGTYGATTETDYPVQQ